MKSSSDPIPQIIFDNGGITGSTYLTSGLGISDLSISGGAVLTNPAAGQTILRSLVVGTNSFFANATLPPAGTLSVIVTNATIQAGGGITADGNSVTPYPAGGQSGGTDLTGSGGGGGGGAGIGGAGVTNIEASGGAPGLAISKYANPLTAGGLGGSGAGPGGPGGGIINLNIPGRLKPVLEGRISANGLPAVGSNAGGGGGGSVQVSARTIRGAGSISANGGMGSGRGGGGGGGAVALFTDTNLFSGTLTAYGGLATNSGGAGTVYVNTYNQSTLGSQLIVDNGGTRGGQTPLPLVRRSRRRQHSRRRLRGFPVGNGQWRSYYDEKPAHRLQQHDDSHRYDALHHFHQPHHSGWRLPERGRAECFRNPRPGAIVELHRRRRRRGGRRRRERNRQWGWSCDA